MRSHLLTSILLTTSLAAQTWAPIGAKWTYKQGQAFAPDTNVAVIEVNSDTMIAGQICSKLTFTEGWFGCHEFVQFFSGSNDSLFYYDPEAGQFHLLFRWNALIGASWSTPIEQSGFQDTLDWSVADTGHVVIDGMSLRQLAVSVVSRQGTLYSESGGVVTERLGGPGAPFTWIFFACDGETFLGLRCYEDSSISWLNPFFPQCELVLGVGETSAHPTLSVAPTVLDAGDGIIIHADASTRLEILDATGRSIKLVEQRDPVSRVIMDDRGLFFVRATDHEGQVVIARVVVH